MSWWRLWRRWQAGRGEGASVLVAPGSARGSRTTAMERRPYTVYGYKGKQVRDNIHSRDLVNAFWQFYERPRPGEV